LEPGSEAPTAGHSPHPASFPDNSNLPCAFNIDRMMENGFKLKEGSFRLEIRKKFFKGDKALAQVA